MLLIYVHRNLNQCTQHNYVAMYVHTLNYLENNVTGSTFLELDENKLKGIVKQIGTVKQLQKIQHQVKLKVQYVRTCRDLAYVIES